MTTQFMLDTLLEAGLDIEMSRPKAEYYHLKINHKGKPGYGDTG